MKLGIELDRESARYEPGESVSGRLVVDADKAESVRALSVELGWRTDGPGDRATGGPDPIALATDATVPAGRTEYPFTIAIAPDAPPTFEGAVVTVAWRLDARADQPLAIDAKAGRAITVAWAPTKLDPIAAAPRPPLAMGDQLYGLLERPWLYAALLAAVIVGSIPGVYWLASTGAKWAVGLAMCAAFAGIVSVWLFIRLLKNIWVHRGLLHARLATSAIPVLPGADLAVEVQVLPRHADRVEKVTLVLARVQYATRRTKDRKRHIRTWPERIREIEITAPTRPAATAAGSPYRAGPGTLFETEPALADGWLGYGAVFTLPPDAMSFAVPQHSLFWRVHATVHVQGGGDWNGNVAFEIERSGPSST